jgi:hypothetical protein
MPGPPLRERDGNTRLRVCAAGLDEGMIDAGAVAAGAAPLAGSVRVSGRLFAATLFPKALADGSVVLGAAVASVMVDAFGNYAVRKYRETREQVICVNVQSKRRTRREGQTGSQSYSMVHSAFGLRQAAGDPSQFGHASVNSI